MNLEEEKGDKKAQGIAFQVESHDEKTAQFVMMMILLNQLLRSLRDCTKSTEPVQEVEIRVEVQPVFQHPEG
ncbi:hypothetical protein OFM39_35615, partial [Escherichia coli]|nr:hypothetical protein [Escherichia coli]